MKKSLSLVLAVAMVFSLLVPAMAFAATSQETAAGNQLKELGILTGNEQGDLLLDQELTRQDMIVLLSRLLNVEEEAASHENTHGWPDVTRPFYDGYISWAKENGLTNGVGDGSTFGFDQPLTVHQLLTFLLRALGYTDVAYFDVPAKAKELGLIAANVDVNAVATRGTMAVATLATLHTEVNGEDVTLGAKLGLPGFEEQGEVAIKSFAAVGAKKLAVTFNAAVNTEKAEISVKRGNSTVTISKVNWDASKTVANLELPSRLIEGEYTVTVKGVAEEDLTATAAVENERVTSIQILNDVAPIARNTDGTDNANKVTVNYVVKNQYGEDVSSTYVPTPTISNGSLESNSNGLLVINRATPYMVNEVVVVTLVYATPTYTTSDSKSLTVGLSAKASEVTIEQLYNEDANAVLTADTSASDVEKFKLILDVKDQYGNTITDLNVLRNDLIVTVGGTHVISVKGYNPTAMTATIELVEINGVKKPAISLANAQQKGTATINVVAKYTGKSSNISVVVEEGLTYDQVILGSPAGVVAADEDVLIPVTVTDTKGNTITDVKKLNEAKDAVNAQNNKKISITISNGAASEFVLQDGQTYLKFHAAAQGYVTVSSFTENFKSSYVTFEVKAEAVPRVIVGLKSDLAKLVYEGDQIKLNKDNILVEDNYGRVMPASQLEKALSNSTTSGHGDYGIQYVVTTTADDPITVTGQVYEPSEEIYINGVANKKGTKTITLQLIDETITTGSNVVNGSQFTVEFRNVIYSEIASIAIEDISTMYQSTNSFYNKEVKVVGTTKDGQKVSIPASAYNLLLPSTLTKSADNKKIGLAVGQTIVPSDKDEATVSITAVLVKAGLTATKEFTVSKVAPAPATVEFLNGNDVITELEIDVASAGTTVIDLSDFKIRIKDQYGVTNTDGAWTLPTPSVTFSDAAKGTGSADPVISARNGYADASITVVEGNTFNVTVKYGDASATLKVTTK